MRGFNNVLTTLSNYHPILIEGMGYYDPRPPLTVAQQIHSQLRQKFNNTINDHPITKPLLVIVQGDPVAERGISAITPLVANLLNVPRGLVCIDPHLNPYHSKNADRDNVVLETRFTDLVDVLETSRGEGTIVEIEHAVDRLLTLKNEQRRVMDKPPLKDYFREFALLQEVTKGACRELCGDITVIHTAKTISEFSVTSFYEVGLELGLVEERQILQYGVQDEFDFDRIDTR